jgi:hypothetical protein
MLQPMTRLWAWTLFVVCTALFVLFALQNWSMRVLDGHEQTNIWLYLMAPTLAGAIYALVWLRRSR